MMIRACGRFRVVENGVVNQQKNSLKRERPDLFFNQRSTGVVAALPRTAYELKVLVENERVKKS